MNNLSLIACVSKDLGIGQGGSLLWHFREDMRFFRKTTLHHPVVMGRKTFASIGHALPQRSNYVLSRSAIPAENVTVFHHRDDLDDFICSCDQAVFIIGGASLYQMYLTAATKLYLTEVDAEKPADTFFPDFDRSRYLRTVLKDFSENGINCQIVEYIKK